MRDGEVSRERDPDAVYMAFIDGHGMYWPDRGFEVEISEGHGKSDLRLASERLSYLKELDREILLVISLICWSKQVADVFLDGVVKHVFPQDDFEIDAYGVEFKHRTSSVELYFEETWPPNDKRIEDRLSVPTDCGTKQHSVFHPRHPARIHSD